MGRVLSFVFLWVWSGGACLFAAPASGTPIPSHTQKTPATPPVSTPSQEAVTTSPGGDTNEDSAVATDNWEEEKLFVPHWNGQLALTYANQPNAHGQAQTSEEFSMTGIYNIEENNTYVSFELTGGEQSLEGSSANYGTLTLEGAWGFGFFQPSLSLAQQKGASALNSSTATFTLNFQLIDPLTFGLLGDAVLESHQGPVSTFSPLSARGDTLEEGNSYNWMVGGLVIYEPWDFLALSLSAEAEYDDTYQFQNILHTLVIATHNQYDRIDSLTLSGDWTFWKDYILELSYQAGEEFQPAGVFYSPVKHKTLFNAHPVEQNFTGFTVGLTYIIQ